MSDTKRERPKGEWFAECGNSDSNNRLSEALAAQGFGYDSLGKNEQVMCHDGKKRPMFCLPSAFVQRTKRAKKGSDVLKFRYWKRAHPDVAAYPMDFIENDSRVRRTKKVRSATESLAPTAGTEAKAAKTK